MTTIRLVRRRRFTTIDRGIVTDNRLSLKAKGLMLWLLDKPDDWQVRSEDIARIGPDGRDSVRSGLQELERAGYIQRKTERLPDGTLTSVCCVYESPGQTGDGFPGAGETDVGSPDAGEPGPLMKTETEDCERRETSSLSRAVKSTTYDEPGFASFWGTYPRSEGKPQALRAFTSAKKKTDVVRMLEALDRWIEYWRARDEPQFIPYAQKWLSHEMWNTAPPPPPKPVVREPNLSSGAQALRNYRDRRAQ